MTNPIVGIDASRAFIDKRAGTENYSYQLIKSLVEFGCQFDFRLYIKPGMEMLGTKYQGSDIEYKAIERGRFWTQCGLAKETWLSPPDLLFIPAHVVPFFKNPLVPAVVTVHDLRTEFLPQHESLVQRIYLNRYTELLRAKLAKHIIAVSKSTRRDLVERLGVDPGKVSVVYEGIDHRRFTPEIRNSKFEIQKAKERYGIQDKYVLFVGTIQPRKNLIRLVEAFSRLLRHSGATSGSDRIPVLERSDSILDPIVSATPQLQGDTLANLELVLAGGKGWNADEIYAAPKKFGIGDRVNFIGYVEDNDLPYLYAGAEIFAFPSLYEGFGLPVLEAMAVGTPVLTSSVSSLPEVGGRAAYYVNPESVGNIMSGLSNIMTQSKLQQELTHRGYQQVKKFSWERAAQQTCEVFDSVLVSGS